jgi:hypothetical protein
MDAIYLRDVDERLKMIKMIQSLDNVYVTHVNKAAQRKADAKRKQAQAKKPVRRRGR